MAEDYLYLDFGANAEIEEEYNRDRLYKVGLKEQFDKLPVRGDYETFIKESVARSDVQVGISFPNFERDGPIPLGKKRWYNIAARIHLNRTKFDLVMMCDLCEYTPKNLPPHRFLSVKGFTLIDKDTMACGEVTVTCDVFARLEFAGVWYNETREATKYLTEEDINNSVFSTGFLLRLQDKYVAEPHAKVLDRLAKWQRYLDSKKEIIDKDLETGYSCDDGPEFLIAYYKNNCAEGETSRAVKFLTVKSKNDVWSSVRLPDSEAAPLFHFRHDFLKKDYDADPEIRKSFERFTSGRSLLLSEKVVVEEKRTFDGSVERLPKYNRATQLMESRISSKAAEEEIQNTAKIDKLIDDGNKKKAKAKADARADYDRELENMLSHYTKNLLSGDLEPYAAEVRVRVEPVIAEERLALVDKYRRDVESRIAETEAEMAKARKSSEEASAEREKLEAEAEELRASVKKLTAEVTTGKDNKAVKQASDKLKDAKARLKSKEEGARKAGKKVSDAVVTLGKLEAEASRFREDAASAESRYDLDEMVSKAAAPEIEARRKGLVAEKRKSLEVSLRPKYEQLLTEKEAEIQAGVDDAVATVLREETRIRLHVFYRLDMENSADPESILSSIEEKCGGREMFLYKDPSGDKAIIARQALALKNLRKGYVMNPFLATALFSSTSQKTRAEAEINHFFSKRLNDKQKEAIRKAVSSNGMFLIRGPPGTGKTEVIAEITAQLVAQGKKVLIASENHKAVDNAFQRLPELPILRRVRLFGGFAAKKEERNPYSVNYLTRNFYNDIAKCLEDEVDKASNAQKYADQLDSIIADLRRRDKEVEGLRTEADRELAEIRKLEADIERLNRKVASDLDDNAEYETEILGLEDTIRGIENVESEVFDRETASVEVIHAGGRLPPETVRALYAMRKTEINRQFKVLEEHKVLFDLLNARARGGADAKAAEVGIIEYEKEHGVNAFELSILKVFPAGIPDRQTVLSLKELVEDAVMDVISEIRKKIDDARSICNDTTRNEQAIRSMERELQETRSGDAFKAYDDARSALDSDIREVLSRNNIAGTFKTASEGIDFLEQEKDRIKRSAKKGLSRELQAAYTKMADYLRDENVTARDEETLNEKLLEYANVIGLTCTTRDNIKTSVGEVDLKRVNLDVVIVDEVSKVSFLEVLYPILYGKTVILVGDDKQLPPTYQSNVTEEEMFRYDPDLVNPELEKEFKRMYESSFFKELYLAMPECNKAMLTVQYRMHPDIMDADNIFYDGKLTYGGAEGNREHYLEIRGGSQRKVITKNSHLVFIDADGEEVRGYSGGTSRVNYREIDVILYLLKKMEANCTRDRYGRDLGGRRFDRQDDRLSLGVICGYADQAKIIRNKLRGFKFQSFNRSDDEQFMVDTVDNFQGDERDIIILSLTATDTRHSFMTKFNRINVAISRARCLLVVVGNSKAFSNLKIELDGKDDYVYRRIVDAAKGHHGYFTDRDVLGE